MYKTKGHRGKVLPWARQVIKRQNGGWGVESGKARVRQNRHTGKTRWYKLQVQVTKGKNMCKGQRKGKSSQRQRTTQIKGKAVGKQAAPSLKVRARAGQARQGQRRQGKGVLGQVQRGRRHKGTHGKGRGKVGKIR